MARVLFPALLFVCSSLCNAQHLTSPKEFFGHEVGDDYYLSNYTQFSAYWTKLDAESDRMIVRSIGKSAEGRDQLMAVVSSPANLKLLDKYRDIAKRLALAKGLSDAQAKALAEQGKAVVWIDGGLHASEVLGAQQLIETCWRMVSRNDAETKRILDDVIILFVHANPDGMELCSNWYMRNPDPLKRSLANLPRLYEKYAGHDNNRDFYMLNLPESRNMSRVMYQEWFPQIMYNHHQTGPAGTVMFAPPFRDPFNHNVDPLVIQELEMVGANLHRRMIEEGKPGTTMRSGSPYSTWWNGGLRTTAYFHNIVGLLTETIGSPTPIRIPIVPDRLVPQGSEPFPLDPQEWHFKQSVEYSVTANLSVLDIASRYRTEWLYNIYQMGRNAIRRGQSDTWTDKPTRVSELKARHGSTPEFMKAIRSPELRDAKAYIIPSNQRDFPTAVKFVNTLIGNGVKVRVTSASFADEQGRFFDSGSIVIPCDQAFRPHILDMFEPQDHPNDIPAPGAAPIPPYDNAGYTLAYQMGVEFTRLLEPSSRFDQYPLIENPVPGPPRRFHVPNNTHTYAFSPRQNDSFSLVNRLQRAGLKVQRVVPAPTENGPRSSFDRAYLVAATKESSAIVEAPGVTVDIDGLTEYDANRLQRVDVPAPRIGLWDRYGGSMESGWTRYILEQFEFPYKIVYPKELDAGNLKDKYDVLVFPTGAIPQTDRATQREPEDIPAEFQPMLGSVTVNTTVPKLKEFLEQGGRIVTIGSSTILGKHLGLPIENYLTEDGKPLPTSKYYVPGSILQVKLEPSSVSWGLPERVDVMFDNSPVFRFGDNAEAAGLKRIAWFDTDKPLRSGWAWGQERLKGGIAMAEAKVGKGTLYLFGPEILFRAQPHQTFKFLFNAIEQ